MPMPLDNKHVNFLDETCFEPFNGKFVEQIYRATDSICAEMRECINVDRKRSSTGSKHGEEDYHS